MRILWENNMAVLYSTLKRGGKIPQQWQCSNGVVGVRVSPSISKQTVLKMQGVFLTLISLRITLIPHIPNVHRK